MMKLYVIFMYSNSNRIVFLFYFYVQQNNMNYGQRFTHHSASMNDIKQHFCQFLCTQILNLQHMYW